MEFGEATATENQGSEVIASANCGSCSTSEAPLVKLSRRAANAGGEGVAVGSGVTVLVGVGEGVLVGSGVTVLVGVGEGVLVGSGVTVLVGVGEGVIVASGT